MKTSPLLARLAVSASSILVAALLAGCGPGGTAKTKMDTQELVTAFASAEESLKGPATEAAQALAAGKTFEGATTLVTLAKAGAGKFSDTQKNALVNLGATIQMVMAEDGDKADLKVYQAVEDLMAALEERDAGKVGAQTEKKP